MRRFLIVLAGGILLLAVLALAGWIALQRIDWNEYKQPIAEAVYEATGRTLDLGGDLDLQIGLRPGVRLDAVAFSNAAWGSRPQMATIEHIVVRFRLLPLLSGELVVSRVELVGLELLLETGEGGVANWEFATEPAPAETGAEADAPAGEAFTLLVQRARIENALVVIRDGETGEEQRITIDQLSARTDGRRGPLEIVLDAAYGGSPIRIRGEIGGVPELAGGGPLQLDLQIEAGGARVGVAGEIGKPLEGSGLDLQFAFDAERLGPLGELAGAALPDLGPVALALHLRGGGDAYAIRDLALEVGSTKISGEVDAALGGDRPRIDARLAAARIDLSDLQAQTAAADRVRPAPGILLVSEKSTPHERLFSDDPLPLDALAAVDAVVSLEADRIVASGISLTGVDLGLRLTAQKLEIERLLADLADGTLDLALRFDASLRRPPLSISGRLRGVQAGALAKSQGSEMIEGGPLDVDFDVAGRGRSVRAIMAGLGGSLSLSMGRATIRDETAALVLSDLGSLLRGSPDADTAAVECALADFDIADGIARPESLVVDLGSIALFGKGKIDLRRERLDLEFDRQAQQLSASGAFPPFTVKGTLSEPKPGIAAGALAGKVVDLGASLLGTETAHSHERPSGCRELLALYRKEMAERGSSVDVTRRAAGALGKEGGKAGKKLLRKFKGLFD